MKKVILLLTIALLSLALIACNSNSSSSEDVQNGNNVPSVYVAPEEPGSMEGGNDDNITEKTDDIDSNILIAYFTYAENTELPEDVDANTTASIQYWNNKTTGNTGVVADMIEKVTGGELFSILTTNKYPDSYEATIDQGKVEQDENIRPELLSKIGNLDDYDTIFLGFPNWWYDMPMAMYSFLDEYDFSGKTIVPFNTSGGSGFSSSISIIRSEEPDANVLDGFTVRNRSAASAEEDIIEWLTSLGYIK